MSVSSTEPLAARMRPTTLDEVVGQEHILGAGKLLRRVIEADRLTNIILYGPPGCGKTTLAEVIARTTKRNFVRLSGVVSGVADIREICNRARNELGGEGTILFVDEIHREGFRRRIARRKGDRAGCAQALEDLADGGRLHIDHFVRNFVFHAFLP